MNPVSVVIPAFNAADTLRQTLDSVLQQTFSDIEVIIVDDGSTDSTYEVAKEYGHRDSRVRAMRQPNRGVAAARNTAIASARGDWIATVDADDIWHPRKLEFQFKAALSGSDAALVYAWSRRIDAKDRVLSDMGRPLHNGFVFKQLLASNFIRNASSAMARREAILQAGGFDTTLRERGFQGVEDIKLYLAIAKTHRFAVCKKFLTGYRVRADSMSQAPDRMRGAMEIVFEEIEDRHSCLPDALLRLARMNYDLYAASLARNAGNWGMFSRYVLRALPRRPLDSMILLAFNGFWALSTTWQQSHARPPFYSLAPAEGSGTHGLKAFEAFQARAAHKAGRCVRQRSGGAESLP